MNKNWILAYEVEGAGTFMNENGHVVVGVTSDLFSKIECSQFPMQRFSDRNFDEATIPNVYIHRTEFAKTMMRSNNVG